MSLDEKMFRHQLEKEEKILYVVHKHWIALWKHIFYYAFFGIIVPWVLYYLLFQYLHTSLALSIFLGWTGIWTLWFFYHFLDFYFDAWICTDISIIDLEWNGIFHRIASRIPYTEVREINTEIDGFWQTVLRYGRVSISMATGGQVELEDVSRPKKVELRVSEIRDDFLDQHQMSQSDAVHSLLADIISGHIKEHGFPKK